MSDEAHSLERAVLERKDREELQTIAAALGAKAPSRARKADIIALILEVTGVTGESSPPADASEEPEAASAEPAGDQDASRARGEAAPATAVPARQRRGSRGRGAQGEAASGDDARSTPKATSQPADGNGADETDGEVAKVDTTSKGDTNAAEGDGANERARTDDADAGNESGNRRRRRRGRDRDRGEEGFSGEPVDVAGLLDLRDEGYGFLRVSGYLPSREDVYVSVKQVRQFGLRKGDHLAGASRPAARNEKNPALLRIDSVNDTAPEASRERPHFDGLVAVHPDTRFVLAAEDEAAEPTLRAIDLLAPIGRGQRGLVVSPPRSGRTTVLTQIARAIAAHEPDVHVIVLLVDERPEEVTEIARSLDRGEVVASPFDRPAEEHVAIAELVLERAKRMVEAGQDVALLVDGLTRLGRAYNLSGPTTGRTLGGGLDSGALHPTKRFFGAARNAEAGGSLTMVATLATGTRSAMDDYLFEELVGTANQELRLDRSLFDRGLFPAVDIVASGTRHDDQLVGEERAAAVRALRQDLLRAGEPGEGAPLEALLDRFTRFAGDDELLGDVASS